MENYNKTFRDFLLTQTTVTAIVSTRIHANELPDDPVLPAIVFRSDGGDYNQHAPMLQPTFQVFCWSNSFAEAVTLNGVLFDALTTQENDRHDKSINWIRCDTLPYSYDGPDDSNLKSMMSYWTIECFTD